MVHPFEVGKTYRNRHGEYVVQAIEGGRMRIRYVDGRVLVTDVEIQNRIWENIQLERQVARDEERLRQAREARLEARKRRREIRSRPKYGGFEEDDFEATTRRIAWSGRESLGKVLAYELSQRTKNNFGFWIVPRESGVHVAREESFDRDDRERTALFFVDVNEEGVIYGFRVGKGRGEAKAKSHWVQFTAALDDANIRKSVRAAMENHDLSLDVYAMQESFSQIAHITAQEEGFLWQHETADRETTRELNWDELAEYVSTVAPDKPCAVLIRAKLTVQQALNGGAGLVQEMASALQGLLPLYDASTGA